MVSLVALCTVALSWLVVTESASGLGDSATVSGQVDLNLGWNSQRNAKVAAAWWAGWHSDLLPLDQVSWKKYTHMTYAFA